MVGHQAIVFTEHFYPKRDSFCREIFEYLYTLCHEDMQSEGHKKGLHVSATEPLIMLAEYGSISPSVTAFVEGEKN